jgi:hypothetical protein
MPCFVILIFQKEKTTSPCVIKRLIRTVISIRITIALIPLTIYEKGTLDMIMTEAKNMIAITYPAGLEKQNSEIKKSTVPKSFTRGSSLCITLSV